MSFSTAELKAITQTTATVKRFQFELEEDTWDFTPGQHTVIEFEDDEGNNIDRPYTIMSLPGEKMFELAIKKYPDGKASSWMHDREVGDEIRFAEPSGNLGVQNYEKDVVFISTGTGAVPMFTMSRDYLRNGSGHIYYFHGEKTRDTILFKQDMELLEAENQNLDVIFSLTDEEGYHGKTGYIQDHVPEVLDSLENKHFYICGVPEMVVQTKNLLLENGVDEENIITEGWEDSAVQDELE